jgi:hypothetical protein
METSSLAITGRGGSLGHPGGTLYRFLWHRFGGEIADAVTAHRERFKVNLRVAPYVLSGSL